MGHAITPTASKPLAKPSTSATTKRRKTYIEAQPAPQPTVVELALQIADSTARSDIEVYCLLVECGGHEWYDTQQVMHASHPSDRDFIDLALAYLDQRGDAGGYRMIRHGSAADLVRFEVKP